MSIWNPRLWAWEDVKSADPCSTPASAGSPASGIPSGRWYATRWCLLLGSRVGGDGPRRGRIRGQDGSLLGQATVFHDSHEGSGDTRMVARGVSERGGCRTLRKPAVDRRHQVSPGRVPARLEHRLHKRVRDSLAVVRVTVPWLLRVVLVVHLLEQRDPAVARFRQRREIAVGNDPIGELAAFDGRAALLRVRL